MAKRRWIPAFAGMTVGCTGVTVGRAGMKVGCAGMTVGRAEVTGCEVARSNVMSSPLKRNEMNRRTHFGGNDYGLQ